jgi:hypothetical protein
MDHGCNGLIITRIDPSYYDGFDERIIKIPGIKFGNQQLYYKTMWC